MESLSNSDKEKREWEYVNRYLIENFSNYSLNPNSTFKLSRKCKYTLNDGTEFKLSNSYAYVPALGVDDKERFILVRLDHKETPAGLTKKNHYSQNYAGAGSSKLCKEVSLENGKKYVLLRAHTQDQDMLNDFKKDPNVNQKVGQSSTPIFSYNNSSANIADRKIYYITEKKGAGLGTYMTRINNLDSQESLLKRYDFAIQLCSEVKKLHQLRCAHFDIKPANITVNEAEELKIIDFTGIREFQPGTNTYVVPEDDEIQCTPLYSPSLPDKEEMVDGVSHDNFSTLRTIYLPQRPNVSQILNVEAFNKLPGDVQRKISIPKDGNVEDFQQINLTELQCDFLKASANEIIKTNNEKIIFARYLDKHINDPDFQDTVDALRVNLRSHIMGFGDIDESKLDNIVRAYKKESKLEKDFFELSASLRESLEQYKHFTFKPENIKRVNKIKDLVTFYKEQGQDQARRSLHTDIKSNVEANKIETKINQIKMDNKKTGIDSLLVMQQKKLSELNTIKDKLKSSNPEDSKPYSNSNNKDNNKSHPKR